MKQAQLALMMTVLVSTLSACSWFGAGAERRALETGSSKPVVIPESLDQPQFYDVMPIPEVIDVRGLAERNYEVGLPEALSTSFGVEQIVIKKLGDEQWVFVDLPPATVWPKVLQFWETNNITPAEINPAKGMLTSEWLVARNGTPDEIFKSLKDGSVFGNSTDVTSHKFRLTVEPGIRSGSTEIYLQHLSIQEGAPFRMDQDNWSGSSDDLELENKILTVLAFYLGETVTQGTISLMATNLQESKAELVSDRQTPVLKYKLKFDRAWATVGIALDNARVPIEDKDRSSANYYVYYTRSHTPKPGFFKGLFSRDDNREDGPANRYTVHLVSAGPEVHVTIHSESDVQPDSLVAERLLRVIKEYST
ncbi:MAG: outer membrane protein assembly factor BamC [Pseudomonadales bacterium]